MLSDKVIGEINEEIYDLLEHSLPYDEKQESYKCPHCKQSQMVILTAKNSSRISKIKCVNCNFEYGFMRKRVGREKKIFMAPPLW